MREYGKPHYYNGGIIRKRYGKYQAEFNYHNTRRRKTYPTLEEAKRWIDRQNKEVKESGLQSRSLSTNKLEDAKRAAQLAKGQVSLTDAVKHWLLHHQSRGGSKTIEEYFTEYMKDLENEREASREYIRETRSRVGNMVNAMNSKQLHEVTTEDLKKLLDEKNVKSVTKKKMAAIWQTFFNAAIQDEHLAINPASALYHKDKGRKKTRKEKIAFRKKPEILSLPEVRKLFVVVEEEYPEFVIPVALSFFAGIRTEEISRMRFEYIHLGKQMEIDVKDEVAKWGEQRFTKIQPNLAEWLLRYMKPKGFLYKAGNTEKARISRYERVRKKASDKAGIKWVHNAGRHSFASYHFRAFENETDTFQQMGHEDIGTFRKHYKNAVRLKDDAIAYWEIRPMAMVKKTIPLQQSA